jgi:CRISPR-associated protein Cmr3
MSRRWTVFFEPLDVLQFRDHRPFDAGEQFLARSIFPRPSVFLGCIRTALFRGAGADFSVRRDHFGIASEWANKLLGGPDRLGTLSLRGPLLARYSQSGSIEPLFPLPYDLVRTESGALRTLEMWDSSAVAGVAPRRFHWDGKGLRPSGGPLSWISAGIVKEKEHCFLSHTGALAYLASNPDIDISFTEAGKVPAEQLYKMEDRVGIQRNADRLTADNQMLYTTRPFRLAESVGFAVDITDPGEEEAQKAIRCLHGQVVPLGGKAHRARVHVLEKVSLWPKALEWDGQDADRALKLWFLTPFVVPADRAEQAWLDGVEGWASGRADPVGGYDMARRAPKALRRGG